MNNVTKRKVIKGELLLSCLIFFWYKYGLSPEFSYSGFVSDYFSFYKLFVSILFILVNIYLGYRINKNVYYFVYNIFFVRYILPGYIMFVFSEIELVPTLMMEIPLLLILIIDTLNINFKLKTKKK